jgi:hypothetical protein
MTAKRTRKNGAKKDRAQDAQRAEGPDQIKPVANDAPALVLHELSSAAAPHDVPIPLTSRAIFWQPRHPADSPTLVHLPFLFWLVETARPERVVQLGLGDGVGFLALCQAIDKLGLESVCLGLDLRIEDKPALSADQAMACETLYGDFAFVASEDPAHATRHMRGGPVDLLLIDAPVDAALLSSLRAAWQPLLSDRALIVIHDPDTNLATPEAREFIDGLRASHPSIAFPQAATGIDVILPGPHQPDRLLRFAELEMGTPGYLAARQVFARLGQGIGREQEAKSGQLSLRRATSDLDEARTRIAELEKEIEPLRAEMQAAQESERDQARVAGTAQAKLFDLMNELDQARQTTEARVDALLSDRNALFGSISEVAGWEPDFIAEEPLLPHLHALYWLAMVSAPARCVALGVGAGSGYFALCAGALAAGAQETNFTGVDDWLAEDSEAGVDAIPAPLRDHNARHYAHFSQLVRATPDEAAALRHDAAVDLLVICRPPDADRLAALIAEWRPSMSDRGVIVVAGVDALDPTTVAEAWPSFRLGHRDGLLVLLPGSAPPRLLGIAAALGPETAERKVLNEFVRAIGLSSTQRLGAEREKARMTQQVEELRLLTARSEEQIKQIGERDHALAEKARALEAAEKRQRDLEARMAQQVEDLRLLTARSEEQIKRIGERDHALAEKARALEAAEKEKRNLEAKVARQREELRFLTERANELRTELERQAEEVGAIRKSTSWRLTAPIRKLKSPLGSLKAIARNRVGGDAIPAPAQQATILRQSPLFDSDWYAARYPDCGGAANAVEHYIAEGAFVGNDPGPDFDTVGYYDRNPDVADSGWPALSHYLIYGQAEGRKFRSEN